MNYFLAVRVSILFLALAPVASHADPVWTVAQAAPQGNVAQAINALRRSSGASPIQRSARADAAARRHAADMARNNFFDHRGTDGSTHTTRLRAAGCRGGAENIAYGPYTGESVVAAWIDSPSHRRNITLPAVRSFGLAQVGNKWVMVLSAGC
ncbi:CAP domain-containing protein [Palleronia rufa]|uniref:CAP domain-containing protein n=1 Tax=Palleronia rufa TaxID=1530186 RepID=UPI00068FA125|nr:CAP domain-containing protein [Palleronia rufa]